MWWGHLVAGGAVGVGCCCACACAYVAVGLAHGGCLGEGAGLVGEGGDDATDAVSEAAAHAVVCVVIGGELDTGEGAAPWAAADDAVGVEVAVE
jgi:hypothetical protein